MGQGRAGGLDACRRRSPCPRVTYKVLTGPPLALWAELKMTLGTGPGGTTREFEVWNTLPLLGCVFTQGGPGVGHRETYPTVVFHFLFWRLEGPSQFWHEAVGIDAITQRLPLPSLCQALRARAQGHLPSLPSLATSLLFSHVHCLSLLGLLKSFSS